LVIEGASERPSLEGIVDLRNTVDTEIITRQAPGTFLRAEDVIGVIIDEMR